MVALVLAAIAGTLALPAMRQYRDEQRVREAAYRVRSVLHFARGRAASMNERVGVDFGPGALSPADTFFTVYADLDRNGANDPGEVKAAAIPSPEWRSGVAGYTLGSPVVFSAPPGGGTGPLGLPVAPDGVSFTADRLTFLPDGTTDQAGHVAVGAGGTAYAVTVGVGGAVRIWAFDGSGWQ